MAVCLLAGACFPQSQVSFESLLASAQQAQAKSDFQSAAESYRRAIALHPEIPELRANLGLMYYELGKDRDAVDAFRESIRLRPGLFVPNLFLGREYLKQKRFGEAIPYLKRASASKPADIQSQLGLAQAYAGTGKTRLAIDAYLQAQKADPQDAHIWYHLGVSYLEQVEADARVLVARHKDSAFFKALVTDNFSQQHALAQASDPAAKDNSASRDAYVSAESMPPSKLPSLSKATELYRAGKYRECSGELVPRLQTLPISELRMLAFCAYSTADYQHAFAAGTKMALNVETEAEGLYWETKSAQKLAADALNRASELDSGSPEIHVLLGDVYRGRKFFSDAEREYRKALAARPEDPGALFGLSLTLLAKDQIDEAFRVAQAALTSTPDDPELNAVMGEVLCVRHDFSAAEPYLKKSFNTKPEYVPHVHALLGNVYAQTGRTEQAIAELKLALQDDKDGTVHYQLGRLYLKIGNQASAKQAFDISERLRGEALNSAAVAIENREDEGKSR